MMKTLRRTITVLSSLFIFSGFMSSGAVCPDAGQAPEPADTVRVTSLGEVVIEADGKQLYSRNRDGSINLNVSEMSGYIQTMGEADPVKQLLMLPGVHASDDYASGFSVEGFNYSQSLVEMDGAPVFFPYHFGGIFSLLNPRFFRQVRFDRVFPSLESSPRLGARLSAESADRVNPRLRGALAVGIISSGISAEIPVAGKLQINLAGRLSYLNQLMSPFLKHKDSEYKYDLADWNTSILYCPGENDMVKAAFSGNADHLGYYDSRYLNDTRVNWYNRVASVQWKHTGRNSVLRSGAWWSSLRSVLSVGMSGLDAGMESEIGQVGVRSEITVMPPRHRNLTWGAGASVSVSGISPARVRSNWVLVGSADMGRRTAWETSLYGRLQARLNDRVGIEAKAGAVVYLSQGYARIFPSVLLTPEFSAGADVFRINLSCQPQCFHQVGFSEIGLASNFWVESGKGVPVEKAYGISLDWTRNWGRGWESGITPYFRWIEDESDYGGGVFDLMEEHFDPYRHLLTGRGYNVGADFTVRRTAGSITGWVSYSFGIARRRYSDNPSLWVSSSHELLNVVKLFVGCKISSHWQVGANFNYSTGRPVTPVTEVYILANNVVMNYGRRNSSRLPDYHRLDLSATYSFHTGGAVPLRHSLNISLLNAYGHQNVEFTHYRYNAAEGYLYRKYSPSLFRFLPSLSYTIEL